MRILLLTDIRRAPRRLLLAPVLAGALTALFALWWAKAAAGAGHTVSLWLFCTLMMSFIIARASAGPWSPDLVFTRPLARRSVWAVRAMLGFAGAAVSALVSIPIADACGAALASRLGMSYAPLWDQLVAPPERLAAALAGCCLASCITAWPSFTGCISARGADRTIASLSSPATHAYPYVLATSFIVVAAVAAIPVITAYLPLGYESLVAASRAFEEGALWVRLLNVEAVAVAAGLAVIAFVVGYLMCAGQPPREADRFPSNALIVYAAVGGLWALLVACASLLLRYLGG